MTTEYKIITNTKNPLHGMIYEKVLLTICRDGFTLFYIEHQTLEICLAALQQNTESLEFVCPIFYQELGVVLLAEHEWKLFYYQGKYRAMCRGPWTAEEALNHWNEFHLNQERATLFREAIVEHQKQLNKIA